MSNWFDIWGDSFVLLDETIQLRIETSAVLSGSPQLEPTPISAYTWTGTTLVDATDAIFITMPTSATIFNAGISANTNSAYTWTGTTLVDATDAIFIDMNTSATIFNAGISATVNTAYNWTGTTLVDATDAIVIAMSTSAEAFKDRGDPADISWYLVFGDTDEVTPNTIGMGIETSAVVSEIINQSAQESNWEVNILPISQEILDAFVTAISIAVSSSTEPSPWIDNWDGSLV